MALSNEIKVGIVFFIGLGLLIWFTLFVTNIGTPQGDYAVRFPRISKLKEGDQVTYNGVRVGTVTEVAPFLGPDGSPAVRVGFTLDPSRKNMVLVDDLTRFTITQGLLGGSAMDIASRSGRPVTPEMLKQMVGDDPVSIDEVLNSVRNLIEENRENIREAIKTARSALDSFGAMSTEIKDLVAENRAEVKSAITNFSTMSDRIGKLVEDNKQAISDAITRFEEMSKEIRDLVAENRVAVKEALDKLPAAVDNVSSAAKSIDDAVTENRPDFKRAVTNIANAAEKFDRIGENLDVITTQIASGKGTIGKLVFEDTVHDKAVTALDNFNDRLEEVKPVTSGFSDFKFLLGVNGGINAESGSATYGAYLRLEPKPWKFYEAGISYRTEPEDRVIQTEDPDKFHFDYNLLLGWRFFNDDENQRYRITVAAGLIESNLGGYVEAPLFNQFSLNVMARQKENDRAVNDRRYEEGDVLLRATISYRLWKRIYLYAGADDLIDEPGFWGGIRLDLLDNDLRNVTAVTALGGL